MNENTTPEASSRFRMLVLDLDGTTLTRRGTVAQRDAAAVRALQDAGVLVTIATGRLYGGTRPVAEQLGMHGLVACMNGSELRDLGGHTVTHGAYLCAQSRDAIRRAMRAHGLTPVLFASEHIAHCERSERYLPYLRSWSRDLRRHDDVLHAPAWHDESGVLAVAGVGRRTAVLAAAERVRAELPDHVEAVTFPSHRDDAWYVKVRDARDDKGTALERMAVAASLTAAQVVAVGDWFNDLPMLRVAGRSFAMGQAHDGVKSSATDVCVATSEEGGAIAEVAERVWGVVV